MKFIAETEKNEAVWIKERQYSKRYQRCPSLRCEKWESISYFPHFSAPVRTVTQSKTHSFSFDATAGQKMWVEMWCAHSHPRQGTMQWTTRTNGLWCLKAFCSSESKTFLFWGEKQGNVEKTRNDVWYSIVRGETAEKMNRLFCSHAPLLNSSCSSYHKYSNTNLISTEILGTQSFCLHPTIDR